MSMNIKRQLPGLMQNLRLETLGSREIEIVHNLSSVWFVTRVETKTIGKDNYSCVFLKPTDDLTDRFHLFGEVLCVLHPYPVIDGRVFEVIERQLSSNQFRLDKLCVMLISNATAIEQSVARHAIEKESRIYIPFKYQDWSGGASGKRELTNRTLESYLYTKNLFAMSSALKTDRYFFGRKADIQNIVGKYNSGENSSLFGLRRIGKTSFLWAVVRELSSNKSPACFIDCADTKFHKNPWNLTLYHVKKSLFEANGVGEHGCNQSQYSEQAASASFQKDLAIVRKRFGKPILLIFDEVENLCPELSPSQPWSTGQSSLPFWQTIRSIYQQNPNLFSFLLCGVNPRLIEMALYPDGMDNPLYRYIEPNYLGFFDVDDVENMASIIGGYMGMTFDKEVFTYLKDDYGGHPFLIRQVCSQMYKDMTSEAIPRKIHVKKEYYKEKRVELARSVSDYIRLILQVLIDRYPQEYQLLKHLSAGDHATFNKFAAEDKAWIEHLVGYGLISTSGGSYHFNIAAVEKTVKMESIRLSAPDTIEERWSLISAERNRLEVDLRELVRSLLKISLGAETAKNSIVDSFAKPQQKKVAKQLKYDDIFKNEFYFSDVRRVVEAHWNLFKNIFHNDLERFSSAMKEINKYRADAHAGDISLAQFSSVMASLGWVRDALDQNS